MYGRKRFGFIFVVVLVVICVAVVAVFRIASNRLDSTVTIETAKSGLLRFGVEQALGVTAEDIVPVFSRYYSDASIELETGFFPDLFNRFLQEEIEAMLWRGKPGKYDVSLLEREKMNYRLEPVARSAIVCIVNQANPVPFLCVEDLAKIYTARKISWDNGNDIEVYLNSKDLRLQEQFLALAVPGENRLTAWHAGSDEDVMRIVAENTRAIGILPFSRLGELKSAERSSSTFRVVPLCPKKGGAPVMPSQNTIYQEKYPLGYIVYYMYRKEKALAAGFGAWLAKEGQKGFVRSSLVPYRNPTYLIQLQ
jgi:phosphate transport system substrate-binding protein